MRKILKSAKLLLWAFFIFILCLSVFPSNLQAASPTEIVSMRTENSKTYSSNNGHYSTDISLSPIHYKNDYSNSSEQWKDIDLTIRRDQIDTAPYTLTINSKARQITIRDKRTNDIAILSVNTVPGKNISKFDINSVLRPENSGIKILLPHQSRIGIYKSKAASSLFIGEIADGSSKSVSIDDRNSISYSKQVNSTIDIKVGASADDCYLYANTSPPYTNISLVAAYEYLGKEDAIYIDAVGMRFLNVSIANGIIVSTAYITFTASADLSGDNCNVTIYGEQNNAAATFSTDANYQGRTRATATVNWSSIGHWTTDTAYNSAEIKTIVQELVNDYSGLSSANIAFFVENNGSSNTAYRKAYSYDGSTTKCPNLHIEYSAGGATVTTQAGSSVEATTATGNGNITNLNGGANCSDRGICYSSVHNPPTTADSTVNESGSFGTGAFTESLTSLSTGTTYYLAAYAIQSSVTSYGSAVTILTKPAAPTNVAASDGTSPSYVTITWTNSTGATAYHIWKDGGDLGAQSSGYQDTTAAAPTITPGAATATDGTSSTQVTLTVSGQSASNGASSTYYVVASNATGDSANSSSDTGYRGTTTLTYAWQRSAGVTDDTFSAIGGGTTNPYNDTAAPAPTITPGTASATDGSSTAHVTLSIAGATGNNGAVRYFYCIVSMTGATNQNTAHNDGYRGTTTLTYAWQVSSGVGDSGFGAIGGATTTPYDYTSAPAPSITPGTATASDGTSSSFSTLTVAGVSGNNGAIRYYYCIISMSGASNADTTHNDGYRGTATLTYAWQRSAGDADNTFGAIGGATTNPYNDTDAVVTPDGRYYYCIISMSGASNADTTHDRGYKLAFAAPTVVTGISSGSGTSWSILNGLVTAQGDAAVSQYGIEYGATTGYGTELLTIANVANNVNYWQTLTGLSTSTQYHYRAKAFNTAWGYGADAIFATKGSPAITTYFNTADDNQTTIWGINTAAQTFTTSATTEYTVTSVRIKMLRVGYPGIVTVSVRHATAGAANSPTGTDLASGAINGNLLDTSAAWYEIPMTTETTLELNSPYCIVVGAASGDSSNYINWRMANAGGLANGNADTSANSGVTWTPQTYDYMFELWGNQALEILSTKVFTGYKSTGDWLIIADTKNTYTPYYPNEDPQTLFQMQLINGSTIVASTTVKAWQRQPLSIYLNSTTAGTLTWGDSYKLRLSLIPNPAIMSEYPLQAVDWQAGDLVYLDGFVRNLAGVYQTYYTTLTGTTVTYLISGANGLLLNQDGAVIFKRGIPELDSIRPDLFQTTQQILPTPNTPITPQAGMTRISLAARVGPLVYTTLTNTGNTMGMTADQFLSFCLWTCIIICALSCGAGFFIGGLIAGIGFVGIGLVLGGMNLVWVILAAFGCIIIIGLRIFIQNYG